MALSAQSHPAMAVQARSWLFSQAETGFACVDIDQWARPCQFFSSPRQALLLWHAYRARFPGERSEAANIPDSIRVLGECQSGKASLPPLQLLKVGCAHDQRIPKPRHITLILQYNNPTSCAGPTALRRQVRFDKWDELWYKCSASRERERALAIRGPGSPRGIES